MADDSVSGIHHGPAAQPMSGVSKDLGPTPSGHVGGAVQSDDLMLAEQLDGTVIETVAGLVDKLD